jgi:hypothetical protein
MLCTTTQLPAFAQPLPCPSRLTQWPNPRCLIRTQTSRTETPILGPDGRVSPAYVSGPRNQQWHCPRWTGPGILCSTQITLTRSSHGSRYWPGHTRTNRMRVSLALGHLTVLHHLPARLHSHHAQTSCGQLGKMHEPQGLFHVCFHRLHQSRKQICLAAGQHARHVAIDIGDRSVPDIYTLVTLMGLHLSSVSLLPSST